MTTKITFGADPEFFVARKEAPIVPVPSCGLFGGAKKSPIFLTPEGGYLEDGCTVEFNVEPKATLPKVYEALDRLTTAFLVQNKDYVLVTESAAEFPRDELRKHPEALVIGCDADYWAYGIRMKPQINMFKNQRFAGGHIHIGLDPWPEGLSIESFVKALDTFMWWPAASAFGVSSPRFWFYGHPGLYRETSYGVEYRTPDNTWALPRIPATKGFWDGTISGWDEIVRKLVSGIERGGTERFSYFIRNLQEYYALDSHMRNRNLSKLIGLRGKSVDILRKLDQFAVGVT